ncbi:MAG: hypothetical protein JWN53_861, partial [Gemmatimonadetes bacterium]|nr:hypothetical protein [Gemmatimonadota bacterium]
GFRRVPLSVAVAVVLGPCLLAGAPGTAAALSRVGRAGGAAALAPYRMEGRRDAGTAALYDAFLRRYSRGLVAADSRASGGRTTLAAHNSAAIPAFARKYGLPCSACHTAWPQLNNFGQVFRDNGYRLKNERDSPIDQAPGYWPAAARITPQFRADQTTNQPVDAVPGDATSPKVERTITQSGFDLSGLDLLMLGTLSPKISFGLIPSSDNQGAFHLEAAYVRFNDLFNSSWANLKAGKFELDNMISEKRELLLSGNGGFYQSYHFVPAGDATSFGLGDNQIGMELSGHSVNSYTRYSAGIFSSTDGEVGLAQGRGYDGAFALSQAFEAGNLGLERVGIFGYRGSRATAFETLNGMPVPGSGSATKPFYRTGVTGDFFLGNLELLPLYMHASDDVSLALQGPGGQPLPPEAQSPAWNAGLLEAHYYIGHQFVLMGRREAIRMSTQALPDMPSDLGNIDATAVGFRWYPIMLSRTGLALHGE